MICPHCERDTPVTEPYCVFCGGKLDLDFTAMEAAVAARSAALRRRRAEEQARSWLLLAVVLFALALIGRLVLVTPAAVAPVEPSHEVAAAAAAEPFELLPLVLPAREIPRGR